MTLIIGFSGKKQSGKNTSVRFLMNYADLILPQPQCEARIDGYKVFPPTHTNVKRFSMAGPLKRFAVEVLGLEPRQVYGTDEDKNSPTRYLWGDLPHFQEIINRITAYNNERDEKGAPKHWRWKDATSGLVHGAIAGAAIGAGVSVTGAAVGGVVGGIVGLASTMQEDKPAEVQAPPSPNGEQPIRQPEKEYLPTYMKVPGATDQMTARQVLQEVGTGIFRRMWGDIWAQACIREIKAWGGDVAFIDDIRFPNEVDAVQGDGGVVVRFTMDIFKGQDQHESECALDPNKFDWAKFAIVAFNDGMTMERQNQLVLEKLVNHGLAKQPPEGAITDWAPKEEVQ